MEQVVSGPVPLDSRIREMGPLYERVARSLEQQIRQGALRAGEKLPSIRALCRQRGVSVSTVLQAYVALESGGWIEARTRSGFYVRSRPSLRLPEPDSPSSPGTPVEMGMALLLRELREAARHPLNVPLGAATPPVESMPCKALASILSRVVRTAPVAAHRYTFTPGYEPLRRQIARRSPEYGCNFHPANVVIANGAMEALNLALRAVARAGDAIAVESPVFYGALEAISSLGMRIVEIPTHARRGMDLDELDRAITAHRVRAVCVSGNAQNPLGFVLPDSWKRDLALLAARRGVPVIEDDVYGDLVYGSAGRSTVKGFDTEGLVLYCGSFSKSLGPGLRIGWLEPGRYRADVERLQFTSTVGVATLQQMALAEYLADGSHDRHLRRLRTRFQANVERYSEAVAARFPPGTRMTRPAGGFLLWVQLPGGRLGIDLFGAARERSISIAPGDVFSPGNRFAGCIRLSCGEAWSDRVEAAIQTLGRLCSNLAAA